MVHPGRGVFGSDFGTVTFVFRKILSNGYIGSYRRLFEQQGEVKSNEEREKALLTGKGKYKAQQHNFFKVPGTPIAYWISNNMLAAFEKGTLLGNIADSKQGIATANNNYYLREWYEVSGDNIKFDATTHEDAQKASQKWYPYNKGGEFRKWYGNNDFVVNWRYDGMELKNDRKAVLRNPSYYFKRCFSWSLVSSSVAAFRYKPIDEASHKCLERGAEQLAHDRKAQKYHCFSCGEDFVESNITFCNRCGAIMKNNEIDI